MVAVVSAAEAVWVSEGCLVEGQAVDASAVGAGGVTVGDVGAMATVMAVGSADYSVAVAICGEVGRGAAMTARLVQMAAASKVELEAAARRVRQRGRRIYAKQLRGQTVRVGT